MLHGLNDLLAAQFGVLLHLGSVVLVADGIHEHAGRQADPAILVADQLQIVIRGAIGVIDDVNAGHNAVHQALAADAVGAGINAHPLGLLAHGCDLLPGQEAGDKAAAYRGSPGGDEHLQPLGTPQQILPAGAAEFLGIGVRHAHEAVAVNAAHADAGGPQPGTGDLSPVNGIADRNIHITLVPQNALGGNAGEEVIPHIVHSADGQVRVGIRHTLQVAEGPGVQRGMAVAALPGDIPAAAEPAFPPGQFFRRVPERPRPLRAAAPCRTGPPWR